MDVTVVSNGSMLTLLLKDAKDEAELIRVLDAAISGYPLTRLDTEVLRQIRNKLQGVHRT